MVNKLAHICDYVPHGDTITALVALEENGKVTYVFASNGRNDSSLPQVERDITGILTVLKNNLESEAKLGDQVLYDRLLRRILALNEARVQSYLNSLLDSMKECIKAARDQSECSTYCLTSDCSQSRQRTRALAVRWKS